MDDREFNSIPVAYYPRTVHNVWMYSTVIALSIFLYFVLKGIKAMWNEVPKFGRRSVLRRIYRVNSGGDSRPVYQHGLRIYNMGSMPPGSTSNTESTSTQVRGNPSSPSRLPFTPPNSIVNT